MSPYDQELCQLVGHKNIKPLTTSAIRQPPFLSLLIQLDQSRSPAAVRDLLRPAASAIESSALAGNFLRRAVVLTCSCQYRCPADGSAEYGLEGKSKNCIPDWYALRPRRHCARERDEASCRTLTGG